jgi:ABC-type nitrate/sulfonate/bicarbonate transport system substrate-binding protein
VAFAEALRQALDFVDQHKEALNETVNTELDKYSTHQYEKLELIKFLRNNE